MIGYDNTFVAGLAHIQLTTINQPRRDMGADAFSLVMERAAGRTDAHVARPQADARRPRDHRTPGMSRERRSSMVRAAGCRRRTRRWRGAGGGGGESGGCGAAAAGGGRVRRRAAGVGGGASRVAGGGRRRRGESWRRAAAGRRSRVGRRGRALAARGGAGARRRAGARDVDAGGLCPRDRDRRADAARRGADGCARARRGARRARGRQARAGRAGRSAARPRVARRATSLPGASADGLHVIRDGKPTTIPARIIRRVNVGSTARAGAALELDAEIEPGDSGAPLTHDGTDHRRRLRPRPKIRLGGSAVDGVRDDG